MKRYITFLFLLLIFCSGFSQPAVGQFKTHLPYHNFKTIAIAEEYVYAASYYSIMIFDRNSEETSYWSKVEGLSDVGITKIAYDKPTKSLVVGYDNGNIDIIKEGKIMNLPDIKNKSVSGSKAINRIKIIDKIAYFLCDFGVVLLDLNSYNFIETWFTSMQGETYATRDLLIFNNRFYLATSKGIFSIVSDNFAIADFSLWEKDENIGDQGILILQQFAGMMLALKDNGHPWKDVIYTHDAITWEDSHMDLTNIFAMEPLSNDRLIVFDYNQYKIFNTSFELQFSSPMAYHYFGGKEAVVESEDLVWVADDGLGLSRIEVNDNKGVSYRHNGPETGLAGAITAYNGKVITVPGSYSSWSSSYLQASCSFYEFGEWDYMKNQFYQISPGVHDFTSVIINPLNNDEVYIASWGKGLFKVKNREAVEWYTSENSPLEEDDHNFLTAVHGLAFDRHNNLWMTNSRASKLVKVLKTDGSWASFDLGSCVRGGFSTVAEHLIVDQQNYKWITIPQSNLLVVINDNHTIDNKSDDNIACINMNGYGDGVVTNTITCIAEDRNGYIWIGTDQGIKVIYTPQAVFSQTVYPQNILIEQMGYAQYLFEYERITAIAVDGGNRKWIGTSKAGVFLISPDGMEELAHFTMENSPLASNEITALGINHENGEVFIGTSGGLISYRGEATKGKEEYEELTIFPNPVREDYHGIIAISGLMEDSFCKIADAAGNLVWQGYALGGQLTWNGKDFHGNRPATGVYFIFASSSTGKQKKVGKMLFIN